MALRLVYGGTFDPFHNGHLAMARIARDALDTGVSLMPAADPPHRAAPGASAEHRAHMLALGIAGEPGMSVDRRELDRDGPSYSIDTVAALRQVLGAAHPLALLVGADSLVGLANWHEWRALLESVHFVVADRPGSPLDAMLPPELSAALHGRWTASPEDLLNAPAGRVLRLNQPPHAESASAIRADIAAGRPWQARVPPAVARYILERGLYGAAA